MDAADQIRNNIIDKLLTISNKDYLTAIFQLLDKSSVGNDIIKVSPEQRIMLEMSEKDILNNRFISQEDIDKSDLEWLKEL